MKTMKLGIDLGYVMKGRGGALRTVEEAVKLCADAGFDCLDYVSDYKRGDWQTNTLREREIIERAGLFVEQSHAPYNRYDRAPVELFGAEMRRSFEVAALLGARHMVVHADEYTPVDHWNPEEIAAQMYEFYAPLVEFAGAHNMDVAFENLFEDHCFKEIDGCSRYCSRVEEILCLLERFKGAPVSCCWDFGHAKCAYGTDKMLGALEKAAPHVSCTHVHDNYYGHDLHILPFMGETDWEAHMALLKRQGYQGQMTFEFVYGRFPDALMPAFMTMAAQTGRYLIDLFDRA